MTLLGKILVLIVFVLSLLLGAEVVLLHITGTNWKGAFDKKSLSYEGAAALVEVLYQKNDELTAQLAQAEKDYQAKLKDLEDKLAAARRDKANADTELATLKKQALENAANLDKDSKSGERYQSEIALLTTQNQQTRQQNAELAKAVEDMRQKKVEAEIIAQTLQARMKDLMAKLEDVSKQLVKARSPATTGAGGIAQRNPPLADIKGVVQDVKDNLVKLSIGSDAGLVQGNTLDVYRLNPTKYLGTVRILELRPNESVGSMLPGRLGAVQPGDQVSSRIIGND
jgi:hypothetical protein